MNLIEIISHRGFWIKENEKNTIDAFKRSFEFGFGIETDIRDKNGTIVISHDIPKSLENLSLKDFLEIYSSFKINMPIFLNVKSDGIKEMVSELLIQFEVSNYFLFDMSIPEMKRYSEGFPINFLTRISDLEEIPILLDKSKGIWIDSFYGNYTKFENLNKYIRGNFKLIFVSPELHNRNNNSFWRDLKSWLSSNDIHIKNQNIFLCTDDPLQAQQFFNS